MDRSLKSFGVSGVLSDSCQVYYDNLFTTEQIGKISDLILAKLRAESPDELKLRQLLLLSVFEAANDQRPLEAGGASFTAPVGVECGFDKGSIAIGIAFSPLSFKSIDFSALAVRVVGEEPTTPLEALCLKLKSWADRLVVRYHTANGRVELVSILNKSADPSTAGNCTVEVVEASSDTAPPAGNYTQLADLDYLSLLTEDSPQKYVIQSPTGEVLVKSLSLEEFQQLVKGMAQKGDPSAVVSGGGDLTNAELQTVKGKTDAAQNDLTLVKGGGSGNAIEPEQLLLKSLESAGMTELRRSAQELIDRYKSKESEFRQAEAQLRANDIAMQTELAARERAIRHRDISLSQTKELLARATQALDKLKTQGAPETQIKAKIPADVSAIRAELDRAKKQAEDFKRANHQLSEKLAQLNEELADHGKGDVSDLKRRLESSMKMLAMSRKQTDRLAAQVDTLRAENGALLEQLKGRKAA